MGQRNDALRQAIDAATRQLDGLAVSSQTARAIERSWDRFSAFVTMRCPDRQPWDLTGEDASAFVLSRDQWGKVPSTAAMHWRRSSLRLLFRVWRRLGLADGDATCDIELPSRSSLPCRPLTDDEVALCRWAALARGDETRRPAAWALAEAGATTAEIPAVTSEDVDLGRQAVRLAGGTKTLPRVVPLTDWGAVQLSRRIAVRPSGAPLAYEGSGSPESAQASASGAIGDVLRRAGLAAEPDVRPRSVTAWVGRQVFNESGRIEDAALRLGMRSLDRTAALIGWDWNPR